MERINNRESESIELSTKALLKAQLLTGQHTLDKKRFVDVAKHHGWLLQIPQRLLV
jgi:hypothetical protein